MTNKDCEKCSAATMKITKAYVIAVAENTRLKDKEQLYKEVLRQKNEVIEEKSKLIAQLMGVEYDQVKSK